MFNTLGECLDQVGLELNGVILAEDFREKYMYGGIPYGTVKENHVEILQLKGKKTKKWLHIIITRMDNGMYELVNYIS